MMKIVTCGRQSTQITVSSSPVPTIRIEEHLRFAYDYAKKTIMFATTIERGGIPTRMR